MPTWTPTSAAARIEHFGLYRHHRVLAKAAHFRVVGAAPREIAIALDRLQMVTAYVNYRATSNAEYPVTGIDGVKIAEHYQRGHVGCDGNPGIAGSISRHNPSLDPKFNEVLRVTVRDEASLDRLIAWYIK